MTTSNRPPAAHTAVERITERQLEVARLVAAGKTNPEIADALGISLDGAKYHVSELLGRLGLERREEVAAWYREHAAAEARWRRRVRAVVVTPLGWLAAGAAVVAIAAVVVATFAALGNGGGPSDGPGGVVAPSGTPAALVEGSATPIDEPGDTRSPVHFEYGVRLGDTLEAIAVAFSVDPLDIVNHNDTLTSIDDQLVPGTSLMIPGPGLPRTPRFHWPVGGREILDEFGPEHPQGIDIDVAPGTAVRAAAAGTVTVAGGDPCCAYGTHVDIDHGGGYMTRYAQLEAAEVERGQRVDAGDVIGVSGASGRADVPMLHFEILRNGAHLNPMAYLD